MPIQPCSKDGKSGHKYGDEGHCYTGPGSRKKAAKQGRAIETSKHVNARNLQDHILDSLSKEIEDEN